MVLSWKCPIAIISNRHIVYLNLHSSQLVSRYAFMSLSSRQQNGQASLTHVNTLTCRFVTNQAKWAQLKNAGFVYFIMGKAIHPTDAW